ncbi:hypothetical protein ACI2LF_22770 [Kribbella sp. NPDC020789]
MQDITQAIHAGQVDSPELVQFLMDRFDQAEHTSITQIDLPNGDSPKVSLRYTKRGALAQVLSSLTTTEVEVLGDEISRTLMAPATPKVSRKVLFAQVSTVGHWSCSRFRLTGAPAQAPRPPFLHAEHPLVMELKFDAIEDQIFSMQRAERLHHEYTLLLTLFVPRLNLRRRTGFGGYWGLPALRHGEMSPRRDPQWFQEYYAIEGFDRFVDEYGEPDQEPISLVPDHEYYSRLGISAREVLDLPVSINRWVEGYFTAPPALQRRLLRAAYWINHALQVFPDSQSSSLISAVQAIESLLTPIGTGTRCPCCGLSQGPGPTANFKEFLDKHIGPDESAVRRELYRRRSQLTHGNDLLRADEEIDFGWTDPHRPFESNTVRAAIRIARISAISWFDEQLQID